MKSLTYHGPGRPAVLHLEGLWIRNVTITTGLVDTQTTPTLQEMLTAGRLDTQGLVTRTSPSTRCRKPTTSSPTPRATSH